MSPRSSADLAAFEAAGVRGPAIDARRAAIQAGLAALDGRGADALALYRDASRRFRDAGLLLDEGLTAIEMATLLDPAEPEVRAAIDAGRAILVRLGARPLIEQLDAAAACSADRPRDHAAPAGTASALPPHGRPIPAG